MWHVHWVRRKRHRAPVAQWVMKQQSPSLCEHCLNNKNKKHFVLFSVALWLYRIGFHSEVITGCDRKTSWSAVCGVVINRVFYITAVFLCCKANVVIKWFYVEFHSFSPLQTTKGIHIAFIRHISEWKKYYFTHPKWLVTL